MRKNRRSKKNSLVPSTTQIAIESTAQQEKPQASSGTKSSDNAPPIETHPHLWPEFPIPLTASLPLPSVSSAKMGTMKDSPSIVAHISDQGIGQLVNSSLMFFSTRPYFESLRLLSEDRAMAPRGLEIIFRNWRPCTSPAYALRFLADKAYCHTIMAHNWTRWGHRDETLFNLVEMNVEVEKQSFMFKELLKVDLRDSHPLPKFTATWARRWRLATQEKELAAAKQCLAAAEMSPLLRDCALTIIATNMLEPYLAQIDHWTDTNGAEEDFPKMAFQRCKSIMNDCRESGIELEEGLLGVEVERCMMFRGVLSQKHQLTLESFGV